MADVDSAEVLKLFHDHLPLVRMVAGQLKREFGPILDYEEMISFGQEGLLGAARRFDPTRAVSFRSYAYYRVRGSIIDGARSRGPLSRRLHEKVRALRTANLVAAGFFDESVSEGLRSVTAEEADQRLTDQLSVLATAMALGFSGECVLQGEGRREIVYSDRADETVEHNALMDVVYEELDNLPDQEATLIRRHFFEEEDIDDISADIGLSKSWGSRLLRRGLGRLAKRLEART